MLLSQLRRTPNEDDVAVSEKFFKSLEMAEGYLNSVRKHNCGTIVQRYLTDQEFAERMHQPEFTQATMEEIDKIMLERKRHTATLEQRCCLTLSRKRAQYAEIPISSRRDGNSSVETEET